MSKYHLLRGLEEIHVQTFLLFLPCELPSGQTRRPGSGIESKISMDGEKKNAAPPGGPTDYSLHLNSSHCFFTALGFVKTLGCWVEINSSNIPHKYLTSVK